MCHSCWYVFNYLRGVVSVVQWSIARLPVRFEYCPYKVKVKVQEIYPLDLMYIESS